MSTSLNRIIPEIKRFARQHGQIADCRFAQPDEWLDEDDKTYPALFFDFDRARKVKNELLLNLSFWVADRITPEEHNEDEVWSDTLLIGCDLLAYLDRPEASYLLDVGSDFQPFTEHTGDYLAGVKCTLTLRVPFPYNRCVIPQKPAQDGGFLLTEDGKYLTTEDGQKILIDAISGQLLTEGGDVILAESGEQIRIDIGGTSGQPITDETGASVQTEDEQNIITE